MAENVNITPGSGDVIGADDISSVKYQRVKIIEGADGTNDGDISSTNGLPVELLASTASIGKLSANSGVDIGDVDITSIAAGDNNIGNVDIASAIPAGTNNIGDVDIASAIPAGDNNIGNVDIVTIPDAVVDANHFSATITSANASTATQVVAKTAAKKIYVTSLMISVGSTALEVQLQSDNGSPQVVM